MTGGVLRGLMSRIQLSGDTGKLILVSRSVSNFVWTYNVTISFRFKVNTPSQMESNGIRGRIHASKATANELFTREKTKWLTPRKNKIIAKGKEVMKTFWVSPFSAASLVAENEKFLEI